MDAQQFLAEFGHIANAPRGVDRLRELILSLAVQGRLVTQCATDEPAETFLAHCANHKKDLIAGKFIRRQTPVRNVFDKEKIFSLPSNWEWTRLGTLTTKLTDGSHNPPKGVAHGYSMISSQNVLDGRIDFSNLSRLLSEEDFLKEDERTQVKPGDVLLTIVGTIGRSAVVPVGTEKFAMQRSVAVISSPMVPEYLSIQLRSPIVRAYFNIHGKGTAQKGIYLAKLAELPITVPPFQEQSRIVVKVDELMALCEKLEAQQKDRRRLQNTLRQSTLQAVANSQSRQELKNTWARLEANFGRMFRAPEDIRLLRDTVFDLGLRGALLSDAKVNSSIEVSSDGAASLPDGWQWKTLADLSEYITSGSRGWRTYMSNVGDAFIRSQDIKNDALIFETPAFVSLPEKAEGKRTLVRQGDLLITITGGNVGKCAIVPALEQNAYVSQHVALIRLRNVWLTDFIHFWMINSFGGRRFLSRYIYGDKPGLNLTQVGSVPIPVPPKAACFDVLGSLRSYQKLGDQLEKHLRFKQELASSVAVAAVSNLAGIAIKQKEDEPRKAPQAELTAASVWVSPYM